MPAAIRPAHLAVLLTGFAVLAYARRFQAGGNLYDEGFLLTFADRVSRGAVVHRDFYSNYGPGAPWLVGSLFRFLGPHIWVERALGIAGRVILGLALMAAGRPFGVLYGAAAFLLCAAWGLVLGAAVYAWILGVALLTLGVVVGASGSPSRPFRRALVAGLLAGASVLFRPELLLVVVLSAIPALSRRAGFRRPWALGLLVGLLPLAIHAMVAGPAGVVDNLVRYPIFLAGPARRLPIPPTEARAVLLFVLLGCAAGAAAAVVVAGTARSRVGQTADILVVSLGLMGLGLSAEALQRVDIAHLALLAVISVSLLPIYLGWYYTGRRGWRPGSRTLAGACAVLLLPLGFAGVRGERGFLVDHRDREFYFSSEALAAATRATLADLDRLGRPGQRLLVAPADLARSPLDDADLYWLSPQLTPATYFIQFDPGVTNRPGSGLDREIAGADLLVLTQYDRDFPDAFVPDNPGGAAPAAAVAANFCPVARHAPYTILTHCVR